MTGTCFETTHFLYVALRGEKTTARDATPGKRKREREKAWKISYEEVVA